jgi:hypothetical protein
MQFARAGEFSVPFGIGEVFPLLCPKREEDWIPGWECEVISSKSGHNEENAIFRTTKPYGTELIWHTIAYDLAARRVDFLISASKLFNFRFIITLLEVGKKETKLTFSQQFTSLSTAGISLLEQYQKEDFQGRLAKLGDFMMQYLERKGTIS